MHIIRYSYGGGSGSIVTCAVATYQISELASYLLAHTFKSTAVPSYPTPPISTNKRSAKLFRASPFLVAHSTSKKTPPFLGPKRCNRFF
jgi:hypothetical protein